MNHTFLHRLPALNAPREIERILQDMDAVYKKERECQLDEIQFSLVASCMYFELDDLPQFEGSRLGFQCRGQVRIRGERSFVFDWILANAPVSIRTFVKNESNGQHRQQIMTTFDLHRHKCAMCASFHIPIHFRAHELTDTVFICIRLHGVDKPISGLPRDMQWFIAAQGLDQPRYSRLHYCSGANKRRRRDGIDSDWSNTQPKRICTALSK